MTIDSWAYASRWRRVHPGEKALFSAMCMIASVLSHSPVLPAVVAGCCVGLAVWSAGIPARQFARALLIPGFFLLWSCVALTMSLSTPGALLPAGSVVLPLRLVVTPQGVSAALHALSRSAGAFSAMLLFAFTTPMTDTITLLRRLRVPELLLDIMSLVYRQVFVFQDTLSRVLTAQASRLGYADARKTRRSLGVAGGHLLANTFQQAQRATQGLLARGYEGSLRCLPAEYRIVPLNLAMGGGAGVLFIAAAVFIGS